MQLTRRLALPLLSSLPVAGALPAQTTAEYVLRDEVRGPRVHLASFPVRPLAYVPAGPSRPARTWAVNFHEDLVEVFPAPAASQPALEDPELSLHVPWGPGAIAYWNGDGEGPDEVLVATRGTWGITRLDATTGAMRGHVSLTPTDFGGAVGSKGHGLIAEPGDLLVDQETDMAFVSCTGADAVVQIDLALGRVVRRYHVESGLPSPDAAFRCKSPLFLSFGPSPSPGNPRTVLVAPLHSGNGTTLDSIAVATPGPIDTPPSFDPAFIPLPDEDLFEISPLTATSPGTVAVRLLSLGTILFAHGIHPTTGEHWILNTEANNGGPANDSEPEVKGRFAVNRLTRTIGFGTPNEATVAEPLEVGGLGGTVLAGEAVGQPFALAFGAQGRAYVCGLLSDNVVQLAPNGTKQREWDLPQGAIPRGLLPVEVSGRERLLVYCWGTNEVLEYQTSSSGSAPPLARTLRLTADSTPAAIQRGRELFFDGERSETGTLSCATCHVDGGSDLLAWDLSPKPIQDKGPMVTQTLVGIEKLGPFHWRGERQLIDFNPAFAGLLGNHDPANGNQLTAEEFADFEAFVFSLRNPANPHQNRWRVVDSSLHHPRTAEVGDAVLGQSSFHEDDAVGEFSCSDCHSVPTGSSSDIFPIFPGLPSPPRTNLMPTALHELWRKEMPPFDIDPANDGGLRAFLGFGFSHGGAERDLFQFLEFIPDTPSTLTNHEDVTDFVFQWDQGLAPAAHYAFWLDADSSPSAAGELGGYLGRQASLRQSNCDVIVIGRTLVAAQLVPRRWFFDRYAPIGTAFRCEDPAIAPRSLQDFVTGAQQDGEEHLFVGYPHGMGERIGLDRDMDGTTDFVEAQLGSDPYDPADPTVPVSAPPTFVRPPQVLWTNTRHARLAVESSTPTTVRVEYREVGATTFDELVPATTLGRVHAPLLRQLRPSTDRSPNATTPTPVVDELVKYEFRVTITDQFGQATTSALAEFEMPPFIMHPDFFDAPPGTPEPEILIHEQHVISSSSLTALGNDRYRLDVTVAHKRGDSTTPPASERIVIGRVAIERCTNVAPTGAPPDYQCSPVTAVSVGEMLEGPGSVIRQFVTTPIPSNPLLLTGTDLVVSIAPTDAAGQTSLELTLANVVGGPLDASDRVIFTVDAVLAVDPVAWAASVQASSGQTFIEVPITSPRRFGQWSFPDTGEALAFPEVRLP